MSTSRAELIEAPLTRESLGARYREFCDDPRFDHIQGKFEIDYWGRITMSPASNLHGMLQMRLGQRIAPLGGEAIAEASILTELGVIVADVAWASPEFMRAHGTETPLTQAPELCIEIASPSNSRKALQEKMDAYLVAGAREAWIVFPHTRRFEFYGPGGRLERTTFALDIAALFD